MYHCNLPLEFFSLLAFADLVDTLRLSFTQQRALSRHLIPIYLKIDDGEEDARLAWRAQGTNLVSLSYTLLP